MNEAIGVSRRRFLCATGAAAALAGLGPMRAAWGQDARPKLVVIGGGPGGATLARTVARGSRGAIDVTLIEPKTAYTTCFFSNLYLGGLRTFEEITHGYEGLAADGVRVVHGSADGIDASKRTVTLADGAKLPYDRLAVAPGIDFRWDSIAGYRPELADRIPHAWKAGEQTRRLKALIEAMPDGGTFLLVAPPNPFRCPPGPYERASMVALYFKAHKPRSKVLILDTKDKFSKQDLFVEGWGTHYGSAVEWLPAEFTGGPKVLHADTMEIETGDGSRYRGDVINLVPAQVAGEIAAKAGLTDATGWCPVDPASMESTLVPGIHVIGDAAIAGDMPKSAFSASSQAKTAAMAIRAALLKSLAFPARYANTCWSLIATGDAVKIGAAYAPKDGRIAASDPFVSKVGEPAAERAANAAEAEGWYRAITDDMFGTAG